MLPLGLGLGLGLVELLTQWKEEGDDLFYEALCASWNIFMTVVFLGGGFDLKNTYLATRLASMICLSGMNFAY